MLVLTRNSDQSIIISDGIEIKVLEIGRGRIKLGISAPDDVNILRGELSKGLQSEAKTETSCALN